MSIAPSTVLVIAGSDSSGGAGIARDITTLTEHGVNACCAITAVTAQTDDAVTGIDHLSPQIIRYQIATALKSHVVGAIKLGMLGTAATVDAVAQALSNTQAPLVLDPVLHSSSGTPLLDDDGIATMRKQLLARTLLLTPNLAEAAALVHEPQATHEEIMLRQARKLLEQGPHAILIKGGHAEGAALDLLVTRDDVVRLSAPRVPARMRGTGCALASSIAAMLAKGASLRAACETAKDYVFQKLNDAARGLPPP